jgi:hypothetical protein
MSRQQKKKRGNYAGDIAKPAAIKAYSNTPLFIRFFQKPL